MSSKDVYQKIAGTLHPAFTVGANGPAIRQGTTPPTSETPGGDGDLYITFGSQPGFYQLINGGWVEISNQNQPTTLSRTSISTSSYTAQNTEYYLGVNYNGAVSLTLPQGTNGKTFVIKDEGGNASSTNTITINPHTDDTIEGGNTSFVISAARGSVTLVFGTEWHITSLYGGSVTWNTLG